ncbi:MAG: GGDEF domain-containing protein [Firmicutes bacterium]|nr:GGDEF domain-containing protein [Bacillota bacterium]
MQEFLDNIQQNLDKIKEHVPRENNSLCSVIESIEGGLSLLRGEINRESVLVRIERELYSSPRSINDTMDHISHLVKKEFEFSRFDIAIIDPELRRVIKRYSKGGFGQEDLEKLCRHGALGNTRDYALNNTEPWIVNDIMTEEPLWQLSLELDVWVHGTFPLYRDRGTGEKELLGLIHGGRNREAFQQGKILNPKQVSELKRLAGAVCRALHEAKLAYFEQGVMKIQQVIGSAHLELADGEDGETIEGQPARMSSVLDAITETIGGSYAGILVREDSRIIPYAFRDSGKHSIQPEKITYTSRPLTGLVSRALFGGSSIIENEVTFKSDSMDLKIEDLEETIYTLIVVPLTETYLAGDKIRKNVTGAIVVLNKRDEAGSVIATDFIGNEGGFSSLDRRILESIAPHVETYISNTLSHRRLHYLSLTDGLTQLANHTHFKENLLPMEFKRSSRYGTPLSVIFADIDHFKVFNDIYGHQTGDLVLREVAHTLRENSREVDHIARYGGEEFAIILPNTTLEDALQYAGKMSRLVKEIPFGAEVRENNLLDIDETYKRFMAIINLTDENNRSVKISIMKNHFNLDIFEIVGQIENGEIEHAKNSILDSLKICLSMGLAFYPDSRIKDQNELIKMADMLLLKAKECGRDRVEVQQNPMDWNKC